MIKTATIGSGVIVHSFLTAVAAVEGICCEAVYSRSREKGQALAAQYGVPKVYTELEEMWKDEEIAVVYVASPNSLHYEQAKQALLHGKHVICEKPFTPTFEQAEELVRLAKENGLFLFDAVPSSFLPHFQKIRELLPQIGRIRLVMSNFSKYSGRYDDLLAGKVTNVFSREFAGGCLQDIGFYNLYFNVAMFGKPQDFIYYPNIWPGEVDTSGVLILKYPDFISTNAGAKDTRGENFVQIEGEKGYLYIRDGSSRLSEIKLVTEAGEQIVKHQLSDPGLTYEVAEIVRILREQDEEACNGRLGLMLEVIEVLEKSRKAAGIRFAGED